MSRKAITILIVVIVMVVGVFAVNYVLYLRKAHSTFENYYVFRGCASLVSSSSDSGTCKLASGETIKIVKFNDRWYLDGDLPVCKLGICL